MRQITDKDKESMYEVIINLEEAGDIKFDRINEDSIIFTVAITLCKWCIENGINPPVANAVIRRKAWIYFEHEKDAMAFKLRWL